jgi:uncharacterized protein YhfF
VSTPLPEPDHQQIAAFWGRARATSVVPDDAVLSFAEPFGDSVELADELLELVLHGPKRATAGSLEEYELDGSAVPAAGTWSIALDGAGHARAVLHTTEVRIGPLSSVDDRFAWDEGEGDRTRASWLRDHHAYFERTLPAAGLTFTPDMPTIFERFEVVYTEPSPDEANTGRDV